MNDWQVGDLALCVARAEDYPASVAVGRAFVVAYIWPDIPSDDGDIGLAFEFEGVPRPDLDTGYDERNFRKIHPDKRETCEPEFVTLLKRSKRKVEA